MENIKTFLSTAIEKKASDIHLIAGMSPVIRVDQDLFYLDVPSLGDEDILTLAREILNEEKFQQFEKNGEVDLSLELSELGYFRVNVYQQQGTLSIAVRIINTMIPTIDSLGLPEVTYTLARRQKGLVLVTGPAGSGKSTTLAAMIDLINSEDKRHVITLEDPIEYVHKNNKSIITQREIGRDTLSFPSGLRAALRQDPDVILVGEMRDLETISIAVTAAETGHLVLSSLHTIDASQSIERIIGVFPPEQQQQVRIQLASCLAGVLSQRLLKRSSGPGRIAAIESLVCTPAVRNLIRDGKIHQLNTTMQTGARQGMQTLDKHLKDLFEENYISREDALEHAIDQEALSNCLKKGANNMLNRRL